MVDSAAELRATSDVFLRDLEVLNVLEEQKRAVPQGDPKLVDLATRIEEIAERVLVGSRRQRELTETLSAAVDAGTAEPSDTIDDLRSAAAILADWRDAERAVRDALPGSAEQARSEELIERFREEYRRAFEASRRERQGG